MYVRDASLVKRRKPFILVAFETKPPGGLTLVYQCNSVLLRYYIGTSMKPNRNDSERRQARAEEALCEAIISLETVEECLSFFKDLCTPAELQALVDRWQVVEYLEKGLPYRKIHDLTGVSVTTIGRVARFLSDGYGGYRTAIRRTTNLQSH